MNTSVNRGLDLFSPSGSINEPELKTYIHTLVGDIFDRQLYLDISQNAQLAIDHSKNYQANANPIKPLTASVQDTK